MKISYLLMQWPKDSEAFVAVDIRALSLAGHELTVKSFRKFPRGGDSSLIDRKVEGIPHTGPCFWDFVFLFFRPKDFWCLMLLFFKSKPIQLTHIVKSMVLLPRALQIAAEVRCERPDVVHSFWGHYPAMVLALLNRSSVHRPVMTTSLLAYDLEMRYAPGIRVAQTMADKVFTHAEVNRSVLLSLGIPPERLSVIRAGVDASWLTPVLRIKSPVVEFITVGRLIESKGYGDVVKAYAALRVQGNTNNLLRIVGSGPYEEELKSLVVKYNIKEFVDFTGHVPHQQIRHRLRQANVFILMSCYRGERLPNVVKEAMACGCPCLVARSPGIDELVLDGDTGYILDPHDWKKLAQRMEELGSNPLLRDRFGEKAHDLILREYNAETQQSRYVSVWKECQEALLVKSVNRI